MDLLKRGLHSSLMGDTEVERASREDRAASGVDEYEKALYQKVHSAVLPGKIF